MDQHVDSKHMVEIAILEKPRMLKAFGTDRAIHTPAVFATPRWPSVRLRFLVLADMRNA